MSTEVTTPPRTGRARSARTRAARFLADNGALVGLALVCLAMFLATPDFLTTANLLNVGVQAAVVAILAFPKERPMLFGVGFAIIVASFDEGRQSLVASRTGSAWDVILDAVGALTGTFLLLRWREGRKVVV